MGIRRIKAHFAEEDGQYIKITKRSKRGLGVVIGTILGFCVGLMITFITSGEYSALTQFLIVVCSSVFFAFYGVSAASGEEERLVPKADLVEIKRYIWPKRVTVVLDDERGKMAKPGGGAPPKPK